MKLGELLQEAIHIQAYGLQSLIMFVVFEKKVLTLDDDQKELDRYFKPRHAKKMNQLLRSYQKKLGMQHEPLFYWVIAEGGNYLVKAASEKQACLLINKRVGAVKKSRYMDAETELVELNHQQRIQARYMLGRYAEKMRVPAMVGKF